MAKRTTKPIAQRQPASIVVEAVVPLQRAEHGTLARRLAAEISGGLPSTDTGSETAKPESKPVEGDASSSSVEASIATAQTTETGEATGQGETGALPVTDPSIGQIPTPPAPDAPQPDLSASNSVVRITSRIEGFRRAGIRHSKTPTDHSIGDFTDEQLALLEVEPQLTVEYI